MTEAEITKLIAEAEDACCTLSVDDFGGLRVEAPDREGMQDYWDEKLQPHWKAIVKRLNAEPGPDEIEDDAIDDDDQDDDLRETETVGALPFPIEALPGPVGKFVAAAAEAIGCDPSFVALPLLACLARAIGNKRVIRLKRTWTEPAIIWAAIIGRSGTHKTPALQAALQFIQRRESESFTAHAEAAAHYEQELAAYDRDLAAWKKQKGTTEPAPWKPEPPACNRFLTSDTTIEALAAILAAQFDGILVSRDELAGWLGGIAEYKGGKGSDLGHWLAAWSGAPLTVDRKTGAIKMMHVPRAAVSLCGGIQPDVLRSAIGREHRQDGLCARLLMAMPESRPVRWSETIIDPTTEASMGAVFDKLLTLEPAADADGKPEPDPMDLTPEAKGVFIDYYNRHRTESEELEDDLRAAWSKIEAYAARFALIFQLCSWASGDADDGAIDEASMTAAIELADWFGNEAKRVYGLFSELEADREQRELVDLIRRRGGSVTAKELRAAARKYRPAGEAETALEGLVRAGLGTWEVVPTGRRPRQEFTLVPPVPVSESRNSRDSFNNDTGTTGTTSKTHANGRA